VFLSVVPGSICCYNATMGFHFFFVVDKMQSSLPCILVLMTGWKAN
jgi:hypothetical protein